MEVKPISSVRSSSFSKFDCGNESLNTYLGRYAKKNDRLGIGKCYVLIHDLEVIGYYAVSMAQFDFSALPDTLKNQLPKYPIPAVRIGKLAIHSNSQGNGLGAMLLMDALTRCVRAAEEVAIFAVIVDAIDQKAKNFYQKFGFIPFKDQTMSLFLPISTIIQA